MKPKSKPKYSQSDVQLYIQGRLDQEERMALEQLALEDPLLLSALKGYTENPSHNHTDHIQKIRSTISKDNNNTGFTPTHWLKYVASIALILGMFYGVWNYSASKEVNQSVAIERDVLDKDQIDLEDQSSPLPENPADQSPSLSDVSYDTKLTSETKAGKPSSSAEAKSTPNRENNTSDNAQPNPPNSADIATVGHTEITRKEPEPSPPTHQDHDDVDMDNAIVESRSEEDQSSKESAEMTPTLVEKAEQNHIFKDADDMVSVLSGQVVNEYGDPIPNATVIWNNTNIGATTDQNGVFSIEQMLDSSLLDISYLGYETKEISTEEIKSNDNIITLTSASVALDEIVVAAGDQSSKLKERTGRSRAKDNRAIGRTTFVELILLFNIDPLEYKSDLNRIEREVSVIVSESNPMSGKYIYTFSILKNGTIFNPRLQLNAIPVFHQELNVYIENYRSLRDEGFRRDQECELIIEIE